MPAKHHSRSEKMAAVALARQSSADQAGEAMGIDPRTISRWLATVEIPDSAWATIEQTLMARAVELTAKGETRGLVAVLTSAGISSRNRRFEQLIARREARRAAEVEPDVPSSPLVDAVNSLTLDQKAFVRDHFDFTDSQERDEPPESEDAGTAALLEYLATVAAWTPEQLAEVHATLRAELAAVPVYRATLIEDGSPEGVAMREAKDVTPGAPEPEPEPTYPSERWVESPADAPDAWAAWKRYEL